MLFLFGIDIISSSFDFGFYLSVISVLIILYLCFVVSLEKILSRSNKPTVGYFRLYKDSLRRIIIWKYFYFAVLLFFFSVFFCFYAFFIFNLFLVFFNLEFSFFWGFFDLIKLKAFFIVFSYVIMIFNFLVLGYLYNQFFFHGFFVVFFRFVWACHISHFLCLFFLSLPCWFMLIDCGFFILLFMKRPLVFYNFRDGLVGRKAITRFVRRKPK